MEIFIMVMLSIIIIMSFILYSKVYIYFRYLCDGVNDDIIVDVYLFRKLLTYRMRVPVIGIMTAENSLWLQSKIKTGKSQGETQAKREQRFVRKIISFYMAHPSRLRHIFRFFQYCTRLYYRVMGNVMTALYCEELKWKTQYGSEDAAITGIVQGMLWAIKSLMISRLKKKVVFIKQPIVNVQAIFGDNHLNIEFQCIFSIRLGNVINTIRNLYVIK